MPRKPRICSEGLVYHISSRGNNKEKIFRSKSDFKRYLFLLRECKRKFKFLLYCYALMPNHIHLVIGSTKDGTISQIMQKLNTSYAMYVNKKHHRTGHLFQGRFFSRIVDKDSYLLELSRYVHLNPVKAGLVNEPQDYLWSSFSDYCRKDNKNVIVDRNFILNIISQDKPQEAYREFIDSKSFNYQDFEKTIKF